jgi:hypothetical protein
MTIKKRYGRWTVLSTEVRGKRRYAQVRCRCGTVKWVIFETLRNGSSKSCGCYNLERKTKHGEGYGQTPEYRAWRSLRGRCLNPRDSHYPDYGGRGITLCKRWHTYTNFLADMGRRPSSAHSIDRKDNNKGYTPRNCRWATLTQQNRNTRRSVRLRYRGKTRHLMEWAEITGIPYHTLYTRMRKGSTPAQILEAEYVR